MIQFWNPGQIDITALTTMGINAKENEHPIGVFGTGIKYAISILVRNGLKVTVWRGKKPFEFKSKIKPVRNKEFNIITMNGKELSWTDRLGLNWELWMAYREMWSNCKDEGGKVFYFDPTSTNPISRKFGNTYIEIEGEAFDALYRNRHEIILSTEPEFILKGIEVYHGRNEYIFYKGIRVGKLEHPSRWTYNITEDMMLTEDRTLSYPWMVKRYICKAIVTCTNQMFLDDILFKHPGMEDMLEYKLPWSEYKDTTPSAQFMSTAEKYYEQNKLTAGVSSLFSQYRESLPGYSDRFVVQMTSADLAVLEKAKQLVEERFPGALEGYSIIFKSTSRLSSQSSLEKNQIILSHGLISEGPKHLAIGILKAWLISKPGDSITQLASYILFGNWIPQDLITSYSNKRRSEEVSY